MNTNKQFADEFEILRVRRLWGFARDQADWETMRTVYHHDAKINISWYEGDVDGFIEGSKKLFSMRRPGTRAKHWFGNHRVTINKDRAFLEFDVEGRIRDYIDVHLFDIVFECRFFDRFEKRNGSWKVAYWTAIYDNDRISPVIPGSVPRSFFDGLSYDGPDAATASWRFFLEKTGRPAHPMVVGGSEEEAQLRLQIDRWLMQS